MEHQLWKEIVAVLKRIGKHTRRGCETYSDADIVRTWFWSVVNDRSEGWACERTNWPIHQRRCPVPSQSRLSRRLRTERVRQLLAQLEQEVLAPRQQKLVWLMDGKPLVISSCSKDRQPGMGERLAAKPRATKSTLCRMGPSPNGAWHP